jgi:hypothetical protein
MIELGCVDRSNNKQRAQEGEKRHRLAHHGPAKAARAETTEKEGGTDAADARPHSPPACAARDMCVAGLKKSLMREPLALLRERERENEREKKQKTKRERKQREERERNTK